MWSCEEWNIKEGGNKHKSYDHRKHGGSWSIPSKNKSLKSSKKVSPLRIDVPKSHNDDSVGVDRSTHDDPLEDAIDEWAWAIQNFGAGANWSSVLEGIAGGQVWGNCGAGACMRQKCLSWYAQECCQGIDPRCMEHWCWGGPKICTWEYHWWTDLGCL